MPALRQPSTPTPPRRLGRLTAGGENRLWGLPIKELLAVCAAFRVSPDDDSLRAISRLAMRDLAQRVLHLDAIREQTR